MGDRVRVPFATNSYSNESLPISAQDLINLYAEREPPDAKTDVALFGAPGLISLTQCGTGPIRGMHVMNNVLYVVSGSSFYSISAPLTVTTLASGITGGNYIPMSDNGIQVMLVNGQFGWVYNATTATFSQVTDPNFFPSSTVTFFDEYFILVKNGSNEWFFSSILDGTTYNALDFESATVEPSFCLGIVNQQENLLIFKQKSIETWYDTGANDNPFARVDGATIERGCAAALATVKEDNSVFFLGDDLIFYRLDGVLPHRVSQHAIEQAWQKYSTVADAYCFSYTWNGHKFVVVTFPTANASWTFDISTGLWHKRISYTAGYTSLGRWGGNCSVEWLGLVLIGDNFSNNIGQLTDQVYTEYGNPILGIAISPPLHKNRKRLFMSLFELDIQAGVGVTVGQGDSPQVMLDWSDDQGNSWKAFQPWQSMGRIGAYLRRLRWKKMGWFWQRYLRITISDPVPRRIMAAWADLSEGM
jgi:hypothetical protein